MIKKIILAVIVLSVIGGGVFASIKYLRGQDAPVVAPEAETFVSAPPPPVNRTTIRIRDKSAPVTYSAADFVWNVENAPDYEETFPKQNVSLTVKGKNYSAGASMGCELEPRTDLLENELTRKTCWFGGAGDEFGVFKEGDAHVVKHRWIQESGGPDVDAPPEGPWEVLFTIE